MEGIQPNFIIVDQLTSSSTHEFLAATILGENLIQIIFKSHFIIKNESNIAEIFKVII